MSVIIKPQPGFQTKVALSRADITIIGGSAGCGKSFIMLYLPLMYKEDKNLRVSYFRETMKQIKEAGALWDESMKLYSLFGAEPNNTENFWKFPSGMKVYFNGIQYEKDLINFQGAQIPFQLFDELTQFSKSKFWFMVSRNRGDLSPGQSGYLQKPQIFASCNPDQDSWVYDLVKWYIDDETGLPIPERDGVVRYLVHINDNYIWGDTKKEVYEKCKDFEYFKDERFVKSGLHIKNLIKSFTFIGGSVYDNEKLIKTNPGYLGSLMAGSDSERARFLKGSWKYKEEDNGLFKNAAIDRMFVIDSHEDRKLKIGYDSSTGLEIVGIDHDYGNNFITCDAARYGRDLCVIFVWNKFTVIHTTIFYLSSPHDTFTEIELLRNKFHVLRQNTIVDQDGVGGDVVKLGGYKGFVARREVAKDETTRDKENYKSRKDQCYFKSADRINSGETKFICTPGTVKIYDKGAKHPRWSTKLNWNNSQIDVSVIIKRQLRAIKVGETQFEGGIYRLCTNTKDEQKEILGHSPDFADNFMMREDFGLLKLRKGNFGLI